MFLHRAEVGSFNMGDEVSFSIKIKETTQQPQAYGLESATGSAQPPQLAHGSKQEPGDSELDEFVGTVKSFNREKGYGFIECLDLHAQYSQDTFVHHLELGQFDVGSQVVFSVKLNDKNQPQARHLREAADGRAAKRRRLPSPAFRVLGI